MLEPLFNACNFIKKRPQNRCFTVNIAKILRTHFFMEHFRWLLVCRTSMRNTRNELVILT